MSQYSLSPKARADLDGIWNYTARKWSLDQAEGYLRDIRAALETLADNPEIGRPLEHVRPGYRQMQRGAHIIFYRVAGENIEVTRILHQSMDLDRHL